MPPEQNEVILVSWDVHSGAPGLSDRQGVLSCGCAAKKTGVSCRALTKQLSGALLEPWDRV